MIQRIYIHNYKNFQNFEICFKNENSLLLLGKNGAGKSNLLSVIKIFQKIGRGVTNIGEHIAQSDFTFGDKSRHITIEIEIKISKDSFNYRLEIDFPSNFSQPRVRNELLTKNSKNILERKNGKTSLENKFDFMLDWHHIGLPLISTTGEKDPIEVFKGFLANMLVLSVCPKNFNEISKKESRYLDDTAANVVDWMRYQLSKNPSLYTQMSDFLKFRMEDFELFRQETTGKDERELIFEFKNDGSLQEYSFSLLSDGEKVFFLAAAILGVVSKEKSVFCCWDEPDSFISLVELGHFIGSCRKVFENSKTNSQLIITSHNEKTINEFSQHNTFILTRDSHLHPTRIKIVEDFTYLSPTLVEAYENGELDR